MINYIRNLNNLIDWNNIVAHLEEKHSPIVKNASPEYWLEPTKLEPNYSGTNIEKSIDKQMCDGWVKANYFFDSAIWLVYRVGTHYPQSLEDLICKQLSITVNWSVINRVDPGRTVPLHIDPDDDPSQHGDKKVRFICQISPPSQGQVLTVGDYAYTNLKVGDFYKWDHYLNQHSAANTGLQPVYYFSIEGFQND
jgi:hypothetical protein